MHRGKREIAVAYKAGFSIWEARDAYDTIFGEGSPLPDELCAHNWELSFETDHVEALYARALADPEKFEMVHPLRTMPWGQRSFRVYDPDGHTVDVGNPLAELAVKTDAPPTH